MAAVAPAQTCDSCHDQAKKLPGTAHAAVECGTCHPGREKFPHPPGSVNLKCSDCHSAQADQTAMGVHGVAKAQGNQAAPDCAVCHNSAHEIKLPGTTEFRRHVADTCGMCHSEIAEQFKTSIHGQAVARGVRDAPECADCHGEHNTVRPSRQVRETCSRCHANLALTAKFGLPPDRIVSYEASFHGLAAKAGSQTVANCGSCHGIHNILPSSDAKSMVHPANLPGTCGSCHPGAGSRFSLGPVHVMEGRAEPAVVRIVRQAYIALIVAVIGLMALHNAGDWFRKLRARHRGVVAVRAPNPGEFRMYPAERLQHALLGVSFLVLAWTGFALKYPEELWARPLVAWESSWPLRGIAHRVAAGVFLATAVLHVIFLSASARLRGHWFSMLPRRNDVVEAVAGFLYNLGLRSRKPALSRHTYVEKAEYWAVVWGAVIMSASGVLLWANNFFLSLLPKTAMDLATVIHFYEAVLATLAIVVWHFYFVIFDPDVYPMDTAWWSGYSPRPRDGQEEKPE
jgi:cytochrome b subunit of formate dehydrogenase